MSRVASADYRPYRTIPQGSDRAPGGGSQPSDAQRRCLPNVFAISGFILKTARVLGIDTLAIQRESRLYYLLFSRIENNGAILLRTVGTMPVAIMTANDEFGIEHRGRTVERQWKLLFEDMENKFGLVELPRRGESFDHLYAITKDLDGKPLPQPVFR